VEEARKVLRGDGKKGHVPKLWDGQASARIVRALVEQIGSARAVQIAEATTSATGINSKN